MLRRLIHFILHSRLENVLAVTVSVALLVFFSCTRLFHAFHFGLQDLLFILLPAGILGVKCLLGMLLSPGDAGAGGADPVQYLIRFFQPLLKIIRDWFPFFLLSACYYALYTNLILRVNPHTADLTLAKIDAAIFGDQPAILLQPCIRPWLTDFLSLVYFSHVLFFPGVALYFYLSGGSKAFRTIMMGYLTLILMGVTSYLLIPAVGPGTTFADRFTRDLHGQMLTQGVDYIIAVGRVSHDCFPSLHVGIPLLITLYLRIYHRKLFVPSLIYVACMCAATVYLRYHYFIDVVASFVYVPAAYCLNNFLLAHWPGEQSSVAPGRPEQPGPNAANVIISGTIKE